MGVILQVAKNILTQKNTNLNEQCLLSLELQSSEEFIYSRRKHLIATDLIDILS